MHAAHAPRSGAGGFRTDPSVSPFSFQLNAHVFNTRSNTRLLPFAMMRQQFRLDGLLMRGRPLVATFAAVILSAVLLVQASTAAAATLSEDMVQASKDACVNLAKRRGFTVDQVISAQPAGGDSASVVLKLMKAGEPYEFKCGFSQDIGHFVAPAPAPAAAANAQRSAVAQAPAAVAQRPSAQVTAPQPQAQPRQEIRRDRAVVVDRNRQGQADANVTTDRSKGGFNAAWLLPLLLLPLVAILLRKREEEPVATTKVAAPTVVKTTTIEALLRNQDTAIEVRSGAGTSHAVTRTLPAGSRVRLSGRYENDWAELAESGWILIDSLSADPRVTNVKSF
jgi:hypothetical protein